jgi:hypothetical protein
MLTTMTEIQVITLLATMLGMTATVLNLVAFVREKDRSHTKAGLSALALLVLVLAVGFLPRYAPDTARSFVSALPESVGAMMQPWLGGHGANSGAATASAQAEPVAVEMLGSFTIEIQRNLFGGIGALVSNFQFSNHSQQSVRVTAYHVRLTRKLGEPARSYDRVLPLALTVPAHETAGIQVELDAEIRDQWVSREDLDPAERGPIEISWDCQDAEGRTFRVSSSNG